MCNNTTTKINAKLDANFTKELNGCWLWTGTVNTRQGHPQFKMKGKTHLPRRLMFERYNKPVPRLNHLGLHCDNKICVNPDHIFIKQEATAIKLAAERLKNTKPPITVHFHTNHTIEENGCWLWRGPVGRGGYGASFSINGKEYTAHRASYTLFNGTIPDGMHVCHICDTPRCVNPDHLFLGTHADNMGDMAKKSRCPGLQGEASPRAKLSEEDVKQIRILAKTTTQIVIASKFGVDRTCIGLILSGKTWSHIN